MKLAPFIRLLPILLWLFSCLAACTGIEDSIELPSHDPQPIVECYLEDGQPIRLLLSKSMPFFAPFDTSNKQYLQQTVFLSGARVIVKHNDGADTLKSGAVFFSGTNRFYNYYSNHALELKAGDQYFLEITLEGGEKLTASTIVPAPVLIDSTVVDWNDQQDHYARIITYFRDDRNTQDHYRYILNYGKLHDSIPAQDILIDDRLLQTENVAITSGFDLRKNAKVFATVIRMSPEYYEFQKSIQFAVLSTQNPVAQPSKIIGNIHGEANPIGIFTSLVFDRDTIVVR